MYQSLLTISLLLSTVSVLNLATYLQVLHAVCNAGWACRLGSVPCDNHSTKYAYLSLRVDARFTLQ